MKKLLELAIKSAIEGGKKIMEVYETPFTVEQKEDKSPLTLADKSAHEEIKKHLEISGIEILSEEGKEIPYENRKAWKQLWIVDPLDGTKEFIKRNGEFTVNIALIENSFPVLGVIYVPVTKTLYFGSSDSGAWKIILPDENSFRIEQILNAATRLPAFPKPDDGVRIVASRSHMSPETETYISEQEKQFGKVELVSMGSSLKICLVAEGKADIYPRFAPTMEWDTAAGQAIAEAAGKSFIDYKTGKRMQYNRINLLNEWFLVS